MTTTIRLGMLVFLFSSSAAFANDCDAPGVSFGEVMAGLQAGFTGGAANDNTLPAGLYLGVSGIDQRGFIDPESQSGWKCDSDWGLVSAWFGLRHDANRSSQEAREIVDSLIPVVRIEVDDVEQDVVATKSRLGSLPLLLGGGDAAVKTWGAFLQPNSLAPGMHAVMLIFGLDLDCPAGGGSACDGVPDIEAIIGPFTFEVLAD